MVGEMSCSVFSASNFTTGGVQLSGWLKQNTSGGSNACPQLVPAQGMEGRAGTLSAHGPGIRSGADPGWIREHCQVKQTIQRQEVPRRGPKVGRSRAEISHTASQPPFSLRNMSGSSPLKAIVPAVLSALGCFSLAASCGCLVFIL